MKTVAYCRVSTNKDEQLDSLEAQQVFFSEYAKRNGFELVNIYADEGKSGTKLKNRTALLKLLNDAEQGLFNAVLIKDVSRLARNTVDFLTSIRKLKSLNIQVIFVNYDQTTSDSSEFMLTLLSAMAQEESANTSKRVKFGKKINMEKGRVPNLVYGYDKIAGELFTLNINEEESNIIKEIFKLYIDGFGFSLITKKLVERNIKTKRGARFNQELVRRIITNQIYIGNVINGKEEIKNFLTGEREDKPQDEWIVTHNEKLRIIDDTTFYKAQHILKQQHQKYKVDGKRNTQKHLFSKLIKCKCCGYSFRRQVRTYKNTYVKWVCSGRNSNGVGACKNKNVLDESELKKQIIEYLKDIAESKKKLSVDFKKQFDKKQKAKSENKQTEKELSKELTKLKKNKSKYMEMFENDIITISELKDKTKKLNIQIQKLEKYKEINKGKAVECEPAYKDIDSAFKQIEDALSALNFNNALLSNIIDYIEVDETDTAKIKLKTHNIVGVKENVHLRSIHT